MTKEQYANEVAEKLNGKAELINKNGNEVWGISLASHATKRGSHTLVPIFYIDDFYNEGYPVEKTVRVISDHIPSELDFSPEEIDAILSDYEKLKTKLYIRLVNEKASDGPLRKYAGMSAEQYGLEDLMIVPYIDVCAHAAMPVPAGTCGKSMREIVEDAIANTEFTAIDMDNFHIITDKNSGAGAIIKAQEWLHENYPYGYILIPTSVEEFLVTERFPFDEEKFVKTLMEGARAVLPSSCDALSDHPYYFD